MLKKIFLTVQAVFLTILLVLFTIIVCLTHPIFVFTTFCSLMVTASKMGTALFKCWWSGEPAPGTRSYPVNFHAEAPIEVDGEVISTKLFNESQLLPESPSRVNDTER